MRLLSQNVSASTYTWPIAEFKFRTGWREVIETCFMVILLPWLAKLQRVPVADLNNPVIFYTCKFKVTVQLDYTMVRVRVSAYRTNQSFPCSIEAFFPVELDRSSSYLVTETSNLVPLFHNNTKYRYNTLYTYIIWPVIEIFSVSRMIVRSVTFDFTCLVESQRGYHNFLILHYTRNLNIIFNCSAVEFYNALDDEMSFT